MKKELAVRLESAEIDSLSSRLTAIKEIEGNPMGVEIKRFGNATAFSAKNIPGPSFNTVKGLTDEDISLVEEILNFYTQKDIPVRFELTPAHVSSKLLSRLHQLGYYQVDFHTTLFKPGTFDLIESANPKITIRELREDEFDLFAEIYTQGFQMPAFLKSGVAQNNKVLYYNENWTFYLASIDNEPAGIGVLYMKDRTASLAAAATLPSLRNIGVQSALIRKRIDEANAKGCDLIVGQAKFGSVSHSNMDRAGMKVGYTKAIWARD